MRSDAYGNMAIADIFQAIYTQVTEGIPARKMEALGY